MAGSCMFAIRLYEVEVDIDPGGRAVWNSNFVIYGQKAGLGHH